MHTLTGNDAAALTLNDRQQHPDISSFGARVFVGERSKRR
jgi:hypothetical protein